MPTYTCTTPVGALDPERRAGLAAAITRAHSEVTGAAPGFAQVFFLDIAEGGFFQGGQPLDGPALFIRGEIRAGRSARARNALMARLIADAAEASGLPRHAIWVYLSELPARAMAEFGHILPEPGDEEAWIAALPEEAQARIVGGGRQPG